MFNITALLREQKGLALPLLVIVAVVVAIIFLVVVSLMNNSGSQSLLPADQNIAPKEQPGVYYTTP